MDPLLPFVRNTISIPVNDDTAYMADLVRTRVGNVMAVLAYGSTLRGAATTETLIDYYVIVDHTRDLPGNRLVSFAGGVVPPNVYYIEGSRAGRTVRAKYAVVSIDVLRIRVQTSTTNPYFWVRFAQPMALAYVRDEAARQSVIDCIICAIRTAYGFGLALSSNTTGPHVWTALFAKTYGSELRPERTGRNMSIVEMNMDYYRRVSTFLTNVQPVKVWWPAVQLKGKLLTVLRLAKAVYTFSGGADYVAWKIERHTGERLTLTDWQKRHPLLAGILILPRLLRKGMVK